MEDLNQMQREGGNITETPITLSNRSSKSLLTIHAKVIAAYESKPGKTLISPRARCYLLPFGLAALVLPYKLVTYYEFMAG